MTYVFLGKDAVYHGVYNASEGYIVSVFYVLLTVHFGIILVNNQLDAHYFSCVFISILYMFQAAMYPSSGELLYQCDAWFLSLCEDDRLVCRLPAYQTVIYRVT